VTRLQNSKSIHGENYARTSERCLFGAGGGRRHGGDSVAFCDQAIVIN
jgi:hypothetical protein